MLLWVEGGGLPEGPKGQNPGWGGGGTLSAYSWNISWDSVCVLCEPGPQDQHLGSDWG